MTAATAPLRREYHRQWYEDNKPRLEEKRTANKPVKATYDKKLRARNWKKTLWHNAKSGAAARGLEFAITPDDIEVPTVCPILGIPLLVAEGKRQDGSVSIDRLDNSKGYVPGNIRIMSWRANNLKGDATASELRRIADWMEAQGAP